MTRHVKGKKHRGVKNPYEQQRLRDDKNKVDRAPKDVDTQEIPRRLQMVSNYMKKVNSLPAPRKQKKKKKVDKDLIDARRLDHNEERQKGMTRPVQRLPLLKQGKGEDDKKFMARVEETTKMVLNEIVFEKKFKVEVERDKQGKVKIVNRWEDKDPLMSEKKKQILEKKMDKKKQRQKERAEKLKMKKKKKEIEPDILYEKDEFEFGDVVYEPPSLDTEKLSKKLNENSDKMKNFLFLDKMKGKKESLQDSSEQKSAQKPQLMARKRMLEEERERAVQAYRDLKLSKKHKVSLI
ncbi:coiled-coil domain-containing protein 137-like [Penaeus japonicus]|uniref:coiled-coil domain-containing protein 137-like n=1 Tax=Penaeus japonicus TaxID=27405 RepID=UPI001C70B6B5|nr:coiled-coil domain-containing protein 137-like [Penaeus japonicus]